MGRHLPHIFARQVSVILFPQCSFSGRRIFTWWPTQCDDVRSELNLLRYEDGKLSDPDTLTRVEALERYIDSKGLGYHMLGVRISFSFVYGVLAQAFSVLSVVLPVLLVQLQEILPVESADASLSGGD